MAETIVLLMLVGWMACALVMTVRAGRSRAMRARDGQPSHGPEPAGVRPRADRRDPALVSRP